LNKTKFAEDDFAIDSVAPFDVDPEFVASLNLQEGGEVEFGESNDPANSMEAIKAELAAGETEGDVPALALGEGEKAVGGCCDDEQTAEAKLQEMMAQKPEGAEATQKQGKPAQQGDIPANMKTIGPLSAGQRFRYMSHQMIQGVKQWFSANWPTLLAGAIAALAAFIGLNMLTGGAIMAALPPLMQVFGVVMGGVALANIAGHIGNYLSQGWAGNIGGAAKSLARGLVAGAVELVPALLFNAGAVIKALKGGLKGTAKAATGAVKNTVKTTVKSVKELGQIGAKGAKTALKNGKIMLGGVKGGFAKGAKSLDDLARRLGNKLRFNKYKIRLKGRRLQLWGKINPEILIAETGEITEVTGRKDAIQVSDEALKGLRSIKESANISPQVTKHIATWSEQGLENAKTWTREVWDEVDELLARKDPMVARVIQEAAERPSEEAIARINKLAQVFRSKPPMPQSVTKGKEFSKKGEKGGYTSTIYDMAEDPNLLIKPAGGRLQKEATAMIELEMLDIPTVYIGKTQLESGEHVLLLEKIEDAVGSKSIVGRAKTPLNPPENTEVVTQRTISDLDEIYRKLTSAGANVGDFQFVIRRSDGAVFVNDPTSFSYPRGGTKGDILNIIDRFKKILRENNQGGN